MQLQRLHIKCTTQQDHYEGTDTLASVPFARRRLRLTMRDIEFNRLVLGGGSRMLRRILRFRT
jgi:hypothetical protein